jgi:transposase InsO family protein
VDRRLSKAEAARQFNTTPKTVAKWLARFRELGVEGLRDRSSRPHALPSQTPLATTDAVEALRRDRHTQGHIAAKLGLSTATVSRICTARGLGRPDAIEPKQPRPRYERDAPGELLHIDIKKLGKFHKPGHRVTGHFPGYRRSDGAGHEFAHVAIDDHSRIACIDILPDEKKQSAVLFLERTVACFLSLGVRIDRVMTDNGACYRSRAFAEACRRLGIKHIMTRPYTPQTNGKAERFIQTALREWAYATEYQNSEQRRAELPTWLHPYNWHRPHSSLGKLPPISRLPVNGNNLLQLQLALPSSVSQAASHPRRHGGGPQRALPRSARLLFQRRPRRRAGLRRRHGCNPCRPARLQRNSP